MLTTAQKINKLREAIALLEDADTAQQEAIGASDACYATHNALQDIIADLEADIEDLQAREAAGETL